MARGRRCKCKCCLKLFRPTRVFYWDVGVVEGNKSLPAGKPGGIYVLTNEARPGYVKVGKTLSGTLAS